jgi:hypothetical protein
MRHFSFDELNFRTYKPIEIEVVGGSRPRVTLLHSQNGQKFFLKSYRHNTREVWAEMLASKLGELARLDVQVVSLKRLPEPLADVFRTNFGSYLPENWEPVGALVRNIFPKGHEQLYGSQMIGTASDAVTLDRVERDIRATYLDGEDILQKFSDMIVFDAWIGNMDRHHENWAVTQTSISQQLGFFKLTPAERESLKTKRQFTQLFDHGSSLLFELGDEKVAHYLSNKNIFVRQYIAGKKYALLLGVNGEKMNVFDILRQHVEQKTSWKPRIKKSVLKIVSVESLKIAQLILQMPTEGDLNYSSQRKILLYFSLEERKNILKEIFK